MKTSKDNNNLSQNPSWKFINESGEESPIDLVKTHSLNQNRQSTELSFIDLYYDEMSSNIDGKSPRSSQLSEPPSPMTIRTRPTSIHDPHGFDRYGFKKQSSFVSEADYNKWWNEYSQYCERRKHKWEVFFEKNGLAIFNDSPTEFPPESEKLRRFIRKGIPSEWRGDALSLIHI